MESGRLAVSWWWPQFVLGALCGPLLSNHRLLALPLWPLPAAAPAPAPAPFARPPSCLSCSRSCSCSLCSLPVPAAPAHQVTTSLAALHKATRPPLVFLHTHLLSRILGPSTILLNSSSSSRSLASSQHLHLLNNVLARSPSTRPDLRNRVRYAQESQTDRRAVRQ